MYIYIWRLYTKAWTTVSHLCPALQSNHCYSHFFANCWRLQVFSRSVSVICESRCKTRVFLPACGFLSQPRKSVWDTESYEKLGKPAGFLSMDFLCLIAAHRQVTYTHIRKGEGKVLTHQSTRAAWQLPVVDWRESLKAASKCSFHLQSRYRLLFRF